MPLNKGKGAELIQSRAISRCKRGPFRIMILLRMGKAALLSILVMASSLGAIGSIGSFAYEEKKASSPYTYMLYGDRNAWEEPIASCVDYGEGASFTVELHETEIIQLAMKEEGGEKIEIYYGDSLEERYGSIFYESGNNAVVILSGTYTFSFSPDWFNCETKGKEITVSYPREPMVFRYGIRGRFSGVDSWGEDHAYVYDLGRGGSFSIHLEAGDIFNIVAYLNYDEGHTPLDRNWYRYTDELGELSYNSLALDPDSGRDILVVYTGTYTFSFSPRWYAAPEKYDPQYFGLTFDDPLYHELVYSVIVTGYSAAISGTYKAKISAVSSPSVTYGDFLDVINIYGLTVEGWYKDEELSERIPDDTPFDGDVTGIYGKFAYVSDSEEYLIDYGSAINLFPKTRELVIRYSNGYRAGPSINIGNSNGLILTRIPRGATSLIIKDIFPDGGTVFTTSEISISPTESRIIVLTGEVNNIYGSEDYGHPEAFESDEAYYKIHESLEWLSYRWAELTEVPLNEAEISTQWDILKENFAKTSYRDYLRKLIARPETEGIASLIAVYDYFVEKEGREDVLERKGYWNKNEENNGSSSESDDTWQLVLWLLLGFVAVGIVASGATLVYRKRHKEKES